MLETMLDALSLVCLIAAAGFSVAAGIGLLRFPDVLSRLHAATKRHRIDWRWVKGHNGDPDNECVDELARDAAIAIKQQGTR